ncbi:hypothetical protein GCM10009737_16480 [Nocardioides lentus]|uniref:PH domain-containing protein n=1 Tax=Nocardioides lentus TaxID=338077 RepID=A0ABN2P9U0_9ACTN
MLLAGTAGIALLLGLAQVDEARGWAALLVGAAVTVLVALGLAREVAAARGARRPPHPRLGHLDGEPALVLPRDPAPTRLVSWALLALAVVLLVGAVLAAWSREWVLLALLLAGGGGLAYVAAPGRDLSGGLWFTPTRVVGDHLGVRWQLAWHDVTGAVDTQPMPLLHHEGRVTVDRTGPRGRGWDPLRQDGMVAVDVSALAGGSRIASFVVLTCVADPAQRAVLGTPASLPPTPRR